MPKEWFSIIPKALFCFFKNSKTCISSIKRSLALMSINTIFFFAFIKVSGTIKQIFAGNIHESIFDCIKYRNNNEDALLAILIIKITLLIITSYNCLYKKL